ncbi:MAG: hypothetical protein JWN42_2220 [Candidatus Angelobacter sp.]|nr:hypothetical protein [Candidatus Angelobacter sp.]
MGWRHRHAKAFLFQRGYSCQLRNNRLLPPATSNKKPLRHIGQEGCVWLEKVTKNLLTVAAASGPADRSQAAE